MDGKISEHATGGGLGGGERSPPIRVLLVDDSAGVRGAVRWLLGRQPDMTVVGEADDDFGGLELAARLHPDAVVMDVRTPFLGGFAALREILVNVPDAKVILFSVYDFPEFEHIGRRAGAWAVVSKTGDPGRLLGAVRASVGGEARSPAFMRRIDARTVSVDYELIAPDRDDLAGEQCNLSPAWEVYRDGDEVVVMFGARRVAVPAGRWRHVLAAFPGSAGRGDPLTTAMQRTREP